MKLNYFYFLLLLFSPQPETIILSILYFFRFFKIEIIKKIEFKNFPI